MSTIYFAPLTGNTAYWDDPSSWQVEGAFGGGPPSASDDALGGSTAARSYTILVRQTEYSSSQPLSLLGLAGNSGGQSVLDISGGNSFFVTKIEQSFNLIGFSFTGGGTVELSGSGTLSADVIDPEIRIEMSGTANDLTLPLFLPGNQTFLPLITGVTTGDVIDLPSLTWTGSVTNIVNAGSLLSFKVGSATYQFDNLSSGATLTSGNFEKDSGTGTEIVFCFAAGTRIGTPDTDVAVEHLQCGDAVRLADGGSAAVTWIGQRTFDLARSPGAAPIRIRAGALADCVPSRDLLVSPEHGIALDGWLVPARLLVNGGTVTRDTTMSSVTYYHVELPRHDVLLANGTPAESWLDTGDRALFGNGASIVNGPDGNRAAEAWRDRACRPLLLEGHALDAIRARLDRRAGTIPAACPRLDLASTGDHEATLPASSSGLLRIVSPACCTPGDARRLGALVTGISVDGVAVPVDDERLALGFHAVEEHGGISVRWTEGESLLDLGAAGRPRSVRIHVSALAAGRFAFDHAAQRPG